MGGWNPCITSAPHLHPHCHLPHLLSLTVLSLHWHCLSAPSVCTSLCCLSMCYETDTLFFSLFPFLLLSCIYTYRDHSLRIVVRRPYSGLTCSSYLFLIPYLHLHLWTAW